MAEVLFCGGRCRNPEVRDLSDEESKSLKPADGHYRAYVGPPERYDFMGGSQFALMFLLGLREHHRLLDFGCGSLRAGRLLISYLSPGNYYGIEPNTWLVEDGISRQLGGMEKIKRPNFSASDSFEADVFGVEFDFILAQSIFSHSGPTLTGKVLNSFARCLAPAGVCAVTFVEGDEDTPEGWFYTGQTKRGTVRYRPQLIEKLAEDAELKACRIPWRHPVQTWWLLGRQLPPSELLASLVGRLP
jgi:SAM-dependent methyltransferase